MSERIGHRPDFGPQALIVWGISMRKQVSVHLPRILKPYGVSMGATRACYSDDKTLCAWQYEFGYRGWGGSVLCLRCFPDGKPNEKYKPDKGWFTYLQADDEIDGARRVIEI